MPRVFVDAAAVREFPAFRRLWLGFSLSQVGSQLGIVAVAYQIYRITGSVFDVGLVSLIQIAPTFIAAIVGGSLADAMNRRTLLLITETTIILCSVALALNAMSHGGTLWVIYLIATVNAAATGIDGPTRTAVMLSIVSREKFISANAVRQTTQRMSSVAGPALGGVLLASFGVSTVYWIDAVSFLTALVSVMQITPRPPSDEVSQFGMQSIMEAFAFFKGRQALQGSFIADLNAMVLGMPTALFPAIGITEFHGGAQNVGLLFAAPGLGAVIASTLSGWTSYIRRPGYACCVAIAFWGAAITGFGFSHALPLALGFLVVAGAADLISVVFLSTIIQTETPDRLRGRITAIHTGVLGNGPRIGSMESGFAAALGGVQFAVVSGGIGCIIGIALIARLMPRFVRYEVDGHIPDDQPDATDPPLAVDLT